MPNHVTSVVTIEGDEEIVALCEASITTTEKDEEGNEHTNHLDFNAIIPQPRVIELCSLCSGGFGLSMEQEKKHPFRNWYAWRNAVWGTKWGSYNTEQHHRAPGVLVVKYESAWSEGDVVSVLACLFSDLKITHEWIDEGWCHCGSIVYENGKPADKNIVCEQNDPDFQQLYERVYGHPLEIEEEEPVEIEDAKE